MGVGVAQVRLDFVEAARFVDDIGRSDGVGTSRRAAQVVSEQLCVGHRLTSGVGLAGRAPAGPVGAIASWFHALWRRSAVHAGASITATCG